MRDKFYLCWVEDPDDYHSFQLLYSLRALVEKTHQIVS